LHDPFSFGEKTKNPILYRGVGLKMSNYEKNNVWGILRGEKSTYSYNPSSQ